MSQLKEPDDMFRYISIMFLSFYKYEQNENTYCKPKSFLAEETPESTACEI